MSDDDSKVTPQVPTETEATAEPEVAAEPEAAAEPESPAESDEADDAEEEVVAKAAAPVVSRAPRAAPAPKKLRRDVPPAADPRPKLSVIFMGHVDAGKSTISGQILWLTGGVDPRTMEKLERESKERNLESWKYAFTMDLTEEERERGKTHQVGTGAFETAHRRYTILDAPGHKAFVPEAIGGAGQADIAVLVVSLRKGEFEAGFERSGQTREHAVLAKTAGVRQLVVLMNKCDDIGWDKERYDYCHDQLSPFLRGCRWTDVIWIPVAGQTGANIKDRAPKDLCPWYTGPSFFEVLDGVAIPSRDPTATLRMPIMGKYRDMGYVHAYGRVESGSVMPEDTLVMQPQGTTVEILTLIQEGLKDNTVEISCAYPGDVVHLRIKGMEEEEIHQGNVLCEPTRLLRPTYNFAATISMLEVKTVITTGFECVMHCHTLEENVTFMKLVAKLDRRTDEVIEKDPRSVKSGDKVIARLQSRVPIVIEKFDDFDKFGRFVLRDESRTIAVGIIGRVLYDMPFQLPESL